MRKDYSNKFVQAPLSVEVKNLIKDCVLLETRGTGNAYGRLEKLEQLHREWIAGLVDVNEFPYFYFINGATEGINQWRMTDNRDWQYLEGEYQWANFCNKRGSKVTTPKHDEVLFISNPKCSTGNFLSEIECKKIEETKCPVILDCTYISATEKKPMKVFTNTEQIFFSFSKGFGLIGQRVGLLYSKTPHPTLKLMKAFECWNYNGVEIAIKLLQNFQPDSMWNKYRMKQIKICKKKNYIPSDTFFLATSESENYKSFRRQGNIARICLTENMNEQEKFTNNN